jgi:hypothetical protein
MHRLPGQPAVCTCLGGSNLNGERSARSAPGEWPISPGRGPLSTAVGKPRSGRPAVNQGRAGFSHDPARSCAVTEL